MIFKTDDKTHQNKGRYLKNEFVLSAAKLKVPCALGTYADYYSAGISNVFCSFYSTYEKKEEL